MEQFGGTSMLWGTFLMPKTEGGSIWNQTKARSGGEPLHCAVDLWQR